MDGETTFASVFWVTDAKNPVKRKIPENPYTPRAAALIIEFPMHSKRWILALILSVPFAYVLVRGAQVALYSFSPVAAGSREAVIVEVQKGQGPREIIRALESAGVVREAENFLWLGRITRQWKSIKAGEYGLNLGMTPIEIFATITSGISIHHPVTVREGENMYEIAASVASKNLVARERFLELCRDRQFIQSLQLGESGLISLEGYLYPDTYFFNRTMSPEEIIRVMVRHFLANWTVTEETRARALNLRRHEVMTLASIIEKETGAADERPLISSVFHNRLRKRMRLQSDPTTVYGIWERFTGNIRKADLQEATPYNTYVISGLPVGPISNPGKLAIQAALNPRDSDYLFFVSHNDGTHQFSRTFEEHSRAVTRFQLDPKARQGKSWRDHSRAATESSSR